MQVGEELLDILCNADGSPMLKANGTPYQRVEAMTQAFIDEYAARRERQKTNKPKDGDMVNQKNYDLRAIRHYNNEYLRFEKSKKVYCQHEFKKIKEDQVNFTKKVYKTLSAMLLVTFIPVLLVTFEFIPVPANETNNGIYVALGIAVTAVLLLSYAFIPCGSETNARKYLHKIVPINFILLFTFSLSMSYLLCRLVKYKIDKELERGGAVGSGRLIVL